MGGFWEEMISPGYDANGRPPLTDAKTAMSYLSVRDVAKILNVSNKLVYRLVEDGELVALKVGAILRVAESDLTAFIAANTKRAETPPQEPRPASKAVQRNKQTDYVTGGFRHFPGPWPATS
jgi:excisionase family DNA binding protein